MSTQLTPEVVQEETPVVDENIENALYPETKEEEINEEPKAEEPKVEEPKVEEVPEAKKEEPKVEESKEEWNLDVGDDWKLGDKAAKEVEEFAKENGLTKDSAQKLLDNQNKNVQEYIKSQEDTYWEEVESWVDELKEDKDFGGVRFDENIKLAQRAFAKYVDKDTQALFDEKGYGNHPGLVKAFARIGKEFMGDTIERGHGGDFSSKSAEELLYGSD